MSKAPQKTKPASGILYVGNGGSRTAKAPKKTQPASGIPDMLAEYDFTQGVRGKHFEAYQRGHTVKIEAANGTISVQHFTLEDGAVMLEHDVREYFPDSNSVNEALRSLIRLVPKKRARVANVSPD